MTSGAAGRAEGGEEPVGESCLSVGGARGKMDFDTQGKRTLIEELTFELGESEIMGVIGSNGIGKSTLAKALCGLSEKYLNVSYGQKQRERLRN